MWNDLDAVARSVLPPQHQASVSRIEPFDRMLHLSKMRRYRNDVELVITIRHRNEYDDPLDACESRCLQEIVDGLKRLGIPEQS